MEFVIFTHVKFLAFVDFAGGRGTGRSCGDGCDGCFKKFTL